MDDVRQIFPGQKGMKENKISAGKGKWTTLKLYSNTSRVLKSREFVFPLTGILPGGRGLCLLFDMRIMWFGRVKNAADFKPSYHNSALKTFRRLPFLAMQLREEHWLTLNNANITGAGCTWKKLINQIENCKYLLQVPCRIRNWELKFPTETSYRKQFNVISEIWPHQNVYFRTRRFITEQCIYFI